LNAKSLSLVEFQRINAGGRGRDGDHSHVAGATQGKRSLNQLGADPPRTPAFGYGKALELGNAGLGSVDDLHVSDDLARFAGDEDLSKISVIRDLAFRIVRFRKERCERLSRACVNGNLNHGRSH
jgi:hypothetical protein